MRRAISDVADVTGPDGTQNAVAQKAAVCFLTDARGWALARYAIASFILSQSNDFDIFLNCDGWAGPDDADKIFILANSHNIKFQVVVLDPPATTERTIRATHVPPTSFRKIEAIAPLLSLYGRIVYSDIDILFMADAQLHQIDLQNKSIGAVIDYAICGDDIIGSFSQRSKKYGISDWYFNAGLIIFNPNNCNNNIIDRFKIFDKTHEQFCPYFEDCCFGDQCIFNLVFTDDWTELPLDLNVQSAAWRHPEWYTAKIRHYTGGEKFLPVIYWRSDLSERRLMQRIAGLLDDKSLRYPLWAGLAAQFTFYRQARMRKCHRPKLDRLKTFIARHNAGAGLAG